jgi:hypothetical protein
MAPDKLTNVIICRNRLKIPIDKYFLDFSIIVIKYLTKRKIHSTYYSSGRGIGAPSGFTNCTLK